MIAKQYAGKHQNILEIDTSYFCFYDSLPFFEFHMQGSYSISYAGLTQDFQTLQSYFQILELVIPSTFSSIKPLVFWSLNHIMDLSFNCLQNLCSYKYSLKLIYFNFRHRAKVQHWFSPFKFLSNKAFNRHIC